MSEPPGKYHKLANGESFSLEKLRVWLAEDLAADDFVRNHRDALSYIMKQMLEESEAVAEQRTAAKRHRGWLIAFALGAVLTFAGLFFSGGYWQYEFMTGNGSDLINAVNRDGWQFVPNLGVPPETAVRYLRRPRLHYITVTTTRPTPFGN